MELDLVLDRPIYSMKRVAPTASAALGLPAPGSASEPPVPEIAEELSGSERLAIVAPDAFGEFAWQKWHHVMPFMESLHDRRSLTLKSILPSVTPVNFACMVTGAELSVHGVSAKTEDFRCETLFDVVRAHGGQSAGVGLHGYTGDKLLGRFADIWGNAGDRDDQAVADKIKEIAESRMPRFLIAQLGKVDTHFHAVGPSSPEVVPMLRDTDTLLSELVPFLVCRAYSVLLLADHGQHDRKNPAPGKKKGTHGTDSPEDCMVPCTWVRGRS